MPRKKSASTLQQVCLENIATNMDELWCKDYEKNFGNTGFVMYTLGPFDECMDSDMIQGVIDILTKSQKLRRVHLDLLITTRLNRLHLKLPQNISVNPVIKMVTCRCQQLDELTLSLESSKSQSSMHAGLLRQLVQGLPNVSYLDLSENYCDDSVVSKIVDNCKKIQVLRLKGCPISDVSLRSMCSQDDQGEKCVFLKTLDVTRTCVTGKGLALVLDKLKNLQFLYNEDMMTPMWLLHGSQRQIWQEVGGSRTHKLKAIQFHFWDTDYDYQMTVQIYKMIPRFYPYLTSVDLVNPPNNDALLNLTGLRLKDLSIALERGTNPCYLTFNEGVSPLLQAVGKSLEKLTLSDIDSLDVGEIGLCCRNLQHLRVEFYDVHEGHMYYTSNETLVQRHHVLPFSKLQSLDIRVASKGFGDISCALRSLLAAATGFKSLTLQNISSFSDGVMLEVLKANPLHSLETFDLNGCDNISGEVMSDFLTQDNQLYKLILKDCRSIYRLHFEEMLRYIKMNKYDVSITWS